MSREKFDDNCPGCKPVILDPETLNPLPLDHPVMKKIAEVWAKTTYQQREAFHNVMCLNSRDPHELTLVEQIIDQLE